jgi:hypothetical protein
MAVTAISRSLPVQSLKLSLRALGSWAVDRILTGMAVTGLPATVGQGAGHHLGLALRQASWAACRVQ